ncbi:calcium/calmodulin-dependent 3',5'-cyclic nucleotide phosphodiesterase 1A isoform X2 [Eurytemora carolleeae]|uniref:calcium/calmodulin-dependent 3',5'-cyclic nucleotide phosphodiesterase 1A isoform X2 n=1 Tax=Eurytemora carolleeae TaxID=1294199 RepID=UPI000C77245B|nr:calcium/calmodulin-dependent 3',5'-cyclic nucleotide phosphodiesterase 1A isoform X2 [Eurytemora carolleeae]|eukprot:XP_023342142.1 calcium/calmodulin-dependent 3',5'-cyclic nucleotide phosphodiesterase 1A-like isoform X2 [Eurytemora affinis]
MVSALDKIATEEIFPTEPKDALAGANSRLETLITGLNNEGIEPDILLSHLLYIKQALEILAENIEKKETPPTSPSDGLEDLQDAAPDEIRKWLAATFSQENNEGRVQERPSFISIVKLIRTGIFIEQIYRKISTSQAMPIPVEVEVMLKGVDLWDFSVFDYAKTANGSPLLYLGYHILDKHGCMQKFKIAPSVMTCLLSHLEIGYNKNSNPYHNNLHASDVLQTTHWFISQTGLKNWLSDLEIFALLFSAIVHDYDHSGTTNNFHIQSGSSLAILYNDRAVLENHHVAEFFRTMKENECNILINMSKSEYKNFRTLMIEMVLHTDMSLHFSQLKNIQNYLLSSKDKTSFQRSAALGLILHSCDISHPAKKWDLHYQWTARCMEEFFKQGDMERSRGLDFSPLCDRDNTSVPMAQIGFINYIVNPTMELTGALISRLIEKKSESSPWELTLPANRIRWQEKFDCGDAGIEVSDASQDTPPPPPIIRHLENSTSMTNTDEKETQETKSTKLMDEAEVPDQDPTNTPEEQIKVKTCILDNSHLVLLKGPILIESDPPKTLTKHKDLVGEIPPTVISRPGSPMVWGFDSKESITTKPPRPNTASIPSPPEKRRAPISVDHKLRKHALDF